MPHETFALCHADAHPSPESMIWCSEKWRDGDAIHFTCINGAWDGIFKDGNVIVYEDKFPSKEVWRGVVPPEQGNYNDALKWIETQL
jgi:hypothetical protein